MLKNYVRIVEGAMRGNDLLFNYEIAAWNRIKKFIEEAGEQRLTTDRDSISEKYNELLMAVEDKFDGETRHETALKYIRFAQTIRTAGSSETKPVS